jgi:V/A-type H+-transporting ATPase subunit E
MAPVEGNIELLTQAVMSQAGSEAENILSAARAKAEAIRQQAREQAAAEREKILEQASTDAERIGRQAVASVQIKARMLELEQREKILAEVFAAAGKQLPGVQRWKEYGQIADQLLREAVTHLGAASAQIHADAATKRFLTKERLAKISKELKVKLTVKGELKQGTGVIVQTEDGRMQYDNTLETRLSRLQNALRSPVYHILMGEAL